MLVDKGFPRRMVMDVKERRTSGSDGEITRRKDTIELKTGCSTQIR